MIPKLSETGWEKELKNLKVSKLTKEKLSAAIKALLGKRKSPVVTEEEFDLIVKEIFFFEFGEKRLLLNRNSVGTLSLIDERAEAEE